MEKKGFLEEPDVLKERVTFAQEGITWTRESVGNQIFSNKVWVIGGLFTISYVTIKKDGSDCYNPKNLSHKYLKKLAWMFYKFICKRRKGIGIF